MARIDNYYRAFKEYRKETKNNSDCKKERKNISDSNKESDVLTSTKYLCTIKTDWVEAIEEGLEFVQKALEEERQFIRVDGEIVPIEKVKKVSKSSVEYLAKHANMITHVPDDGSDIIPDELYITEKSSDYAVYENRFLYMLLRYLEDFIFFRIDKIEQLRATYVGNFSVQKNIVSPKRNLEIEMKIKEKREDNPYPILDSETNKALQRIKDCHQIVSALLSTPLMQEVSKSPMIKPPITKTNVLKMNNNFKRSLALYEYVSAYNELGYSYEEVVKDYSPFNEQNADELADSLNLTSFLTYKIGNDIEGILESSYEEEERRRKEEEERKLDERIKRLKKRAEESKMSLEEFCILLETRNQQLLHDAESLSLAKIEIEKLNREIDNLNLEKLELNRRIEELYSVIDEKIKEIARLNQKYIDDMAALKKQHALEIAELNKAHEEEISALNEKHASEIDELNEIHDRELEKLESECEEKINELNLAHDKEVARLESEHKEEIILINTRHENEIESKIEESVRDRKTLVSTYESKISSLTQSHKNEINDATSKIAVLDTNLKSTTEDRNRKVKMYEEKIKSLTESYEDMLAMERGTVQKLTEENNNLKEKNSLVQGELVAMRVEAGKTAPSDDYSNKERFTELLMSYEIMEKFMKEQWKLTKKKIKEDAESQIQKDIEEKNKIKESLESSENKETQEEVTQEENTNQE